MEKLFKTFYNNKIFKFQNNGFVKNDLSFIFILIEEISIHSDNKTLLLSY